MKWICWNFVFSMKRVPSFKKKFLLKSKNETKSIHLFRAEIFSRKRKYFENATSHSFSTFKWILYIYSLVFYVDDEVFCVIAKKKEFFSNIFRYLCFFPSNMYEVWNGRETLLYFHSTEKCTPKFENIQNFVRIYIPNWPSAKNSNERVYDNAISLTLYS